MIGCRKKGPATSGKVDPGERIVRDQNTLHVLQPQRRAGRFPRCGLFDLQVVDRFPAPCPFGQREPFEAVRSYRDRGFDRISQGDYEGGRGDLEHAETCSTCVGGLLADPHVKHLRRVLGVDR